MKKILNSKKKSNSHALSHTIIAVLTCLLMVTIIQWDRGLFKAEFREGDIALSSIYAPYDFNIKGEVNTRATDIARKKAADSVLPIYIFDAGVQQNVLNKAKAIVDSVSLLKTEPDLADEEKKTKVAAVSADYNISEALTTSILELKDHEMFYDSVKDAIERLMLKGIISASERSMLVENEIKRIKVLDKIEDTESTAWVEDFFTLGDLKENMEDFSSGIRGRKERSAANDFMKAILSTNIIYDEEKTAAEKDELAQKINPIRNTIEVKKNEMILNKGERIGKDHIVKLKGIEQNESMAMKIGGLFGILLLVGLFMLIVVLYVKFYEPIFIAANKELVLLSVVSFLILVAAKIIVMSPWPSNLVPVAVASMLIAILINSRMAMIATCFLSILVGMIAGNILDIAGVSLVGGMVGIFAMKGVRRRSQVMTAGLCVGFANVSYLIGMGLVRGLDFNTYITQALFGLTNGIMSAVIVTGILPVFENIFKITTDISLLELADLNHPLLKEMVMKAPGTYHHSLVVGNLAEAACEAIGANPLLARVSSYFHDIGKIEKASYFSENQSSEGSAHDKLSPTMSSLIITNHVKNGVELAQKHKLNKKIIDIIRQHHGTGLVFYFFKRALEKVTDEDVGEQSFRYPGPKPQTKEAACVLLADSVEAGSRALDNPTPSRIKGLVKKIINNKFIDGQLDECDLTLKNLERIAEVFMHILTGIFHTRVEYPDGPEKE
ncbi:MAG: HDIG domain-containing protein [Candidatus Gorgyraea atricola]|nr:HDIG domain-containing protein [Candidatus Gorgyraea atricola]